MTCLTSEETCESDGFATSSYWGLLVRFLTSDEANFDERHHIFELVEWFYYRLEDSDLAESDIWPIIKYAFGTVETHYYIEDDRYDEVFDQDEEEVVRWIVNHVLSSFDLYQFIRGQEPCPENEVF